MDTRTPSADALQRELDQVMREIRTLRPVVASLNRRREDGTLTDDDKAHAEAVITAFDRLEGKVAALVEADALTGG